MSRLPFLPSIRRLSAASSLANQALTVNRKQIRFTGETAGARSAGLKFNGLIRLKVFERGGYRPSGSCVGEQGCEYRTIVAWAGVGKSKLVTFGSDGWLLIIIVLRPEPSRCLFDLR